MAKRQTSQFNTRQYMLSEDYEVFYYSDTHFRSVGSHSHGYYELYFFEAGAVTMEIDGRGYPLKTGDVILIPPGVSHRALLTDPEKPYRRFVFWQSRPFLEALEARSPDCGYLLRRAESRGRYVYRFDPVAFNAIRTRLFTLLDEIHADRFGKATAIDLIITDLLLFLGRTVYEQEQRRNRKEQLSRYEAITQYVDQHLDEPLSLDALARQFYLSKYYLVHLFRENAGLSVHQYILKRRLAACCDAMQGGAAVGEAYRQWGFGDYSAFYRAFRKEYSMSPSAYLELHSL
jgi:AraC-like DNA-binding protein